MKYLVDIYVFLNLNVAFLFLCVFFSLFVCLFVRSSSYHYNPYCLLDYICVVSQFGWKFSTNVSLLSWLSPWGWRVLTSQGSCTYVPYLFFAVSYKSLYIYIFMIDIYLNAIVFAMVTEIYIYSVFIYEQWPKQCFFIYIVFYRGMHYPVTNGLYWSKNQHKGIPYKPISILECPKGVESCSVEFLSHQTMTRGGRWRSDGIETRFLALESSCGWQETTD